MKRRWQNSQTFEQTRTVRNIKVCNKKQLDFREKNSAISVIKNWIIFNTYFMMLFLCHIVIWMCQYSSSDCWLCGLCVRLADGVRTGLPSTQAWRTLRLHQGGLRVVAGIFVGIQGGTLWQSIWPCGQISDILAILCQNLWPVWNSADSCLIGCSDLDWWDIFIITNNNTNNSYTTNN